MKKLTTYTAVIASIIYLAGCGGGSSSSTSASTDSKTNFYIANQTGKEFAKVEVYYDGAPSQEQKTLLCGAASECVLALDANAGASNFTLKFFNEASNLVAAYSYIKNIDDDNYLVVNNATLGLYIFKEVKSKYDWTGDVLSRRVSWFFGKVDSPDKINDDNEELGIYYLQQTADNKLSYDQFLASLNKSLDNYEVYGGDSQLLVKSVAAPKLALSSVASSNCPATTEKFGGFIQKVAKVIPYAPVQKALDGAVSAIDSGCGTRLGNTIGNVRKDLVDIKAKIEKVQEELSFLGLEISQWRMQSQWVSANNAYNELLVEFATLETSNNTYRDFLITNNTPNLVAYFKTHELTKNSIESNATLDEIFKSLTKVNRSLTILEKTTSLQTLSASLRGICANADNIIGDILDTRDKCNIFAAEVIAEYMSALNASTAMVRDIAQTLGPIKNPGEIVVNPFGKETWYSSNESEDTVFKAMGQRLTSALNKVSSEMDGVFIGSFEGLDANLQAKLVETNCALSAANTGGKLPAILAWEGRRGTTKFIITECRTPDGNLPVVGRYDYEGFDNTAGIANAFGAIVDKKIFSDDYHPPGYFGIELNANRVPNYLRVSGGSFVQNNRPLSSQKNQSLIRNDSNQTLNWPKVDYIDLYVEPGLYKTEFNGESPGYGTLMGSQYTEKHQTFIDVWMSVVHDYQIICTYCVPPHIVDRKLGCLHKGCTSVNQSGLNGEIGFTHYLSKQITKIKVIGDDKTKTISMEIKNVAPAP